VTRGQLPQRAGSLGLNDGGAAATVPPGEARRGEGNGEEGYTTPRQELSLDVVV